MIILEPYRAVGPVTFGMDSQKVRTALGEPKLLTKNRRGDTVLRYGGLHITLSSQGVVEIELLPEIESSLAGVNIFSDSDALDTLCALDGDPQQCLGAIILMNLGVSLTGFHDEDERQKSVTAFAKGRFDILKPQMTMFSDSSA